MATFKANGSLRDFQEFVETVYGANNRKHFTIDEMLINVQRFTMRGLKGIRKNDKKKTAKNMLAALSWVLSLFNLLGIDLQDEVWKRFPYRCSYCGQCPCVCRAKKVQKRSRGKALRTAEPRTLSGLQTMFEKIYPSSARTLEHAGIHLAEEMGELAEAVLRFRGTHADKDFDEIRLEAADLFSCYVGVLNSIGVSISESRGKSHAYGCASCGKAPCACDYRFVINFKS